MEPLVELHEPDEAESSCLFSVATQPNGKISENLIGFVESSLAAYNRFLHLFFSFQTVMATVMVTGRIQLALVTLRLIHLNLKTKMKLTTTTV